MLEYSDYCGGIDCKREDGSSAAIIYFANCGKYIIDVVDPFAAPDELRQIADKLDELNKENK